MPLLYDPTGEPIEIAQGRGDLRWSSVPFSEYDSSAPLVGGNVSFGRIFATQTWVAAVVMRLLSWSVRVPLKAYRRTGDDSRERLRPREHPLAAAIVAPWEHGSQAALTQALLGPLLVHGNGVVQVDEGRDGAIRFTPRDWRKLTPIRVAGDSSRVRGWTFTDVDADDVTIAATEATHLAWWSPLGPLGVSPLAQLGVTLSIEDAAQRWQRAMLHNGARPPSAIKASDEWLGLDGADKERLLAQLRADINAIYSGPENQGKPALLPPGLDWESIGHTAVEAELIQQRRVTREEVAAVYQMPPPLVGIYDRATFSNIETAREIGYTDSLAPPLVLIEQVINAQVVRGLLREPDIYVEWDFGGVLRGDRLKEIQAIREAVATAVLTPNEGRATLNRPRSDQDGMDDFYLPTNNLQKVGAEPGEAVRAL